MTQAAQAKETTRRACAAAMAYRADPVVRARLMQDLVGRRRIAVAESPLHQAAEDEA